MSDKGKRVYLPADTDMLLTTMAKSEGLKKSQLVLRALRVYRVLPPADAARLLNQAREADAKERS